MEGKDEETEDMTKKTKISYKKKKMKDHMRYEAKIRTKLHEQRNNGLNGAYTMPKKKRGDHYMALTILKNQRQVVEMKGT